MGWSTAMLDWEERILAGRSLVPALPLHMDEAEKAVRIFDRLRLPDVIGQPSFAECGGTWFRDIVRSLFGAYDPETDRRHLQEVFLLVPKKNAKTTGAAAVMLTALIMNPVHNAEALLIAPTKEIADTAFGQAMGMIRADDELTKVFHVARHERRITHRLSGAHLRVKAADTDVITGVKSRYILIDEVHVFAEHSRARDVFVEIRGALAANPGGFLFMITTQSKRPPSGIFKTELERARAVRDGRRTAPLLPVLYELPRDMQTPPRPGERAPWQDPATFRLVNPNIDRSARSSFLVQALADAEADGTDALALFASQHLNVEIGVGLTSDAWAGAAVWSRGDGGPRTLEELIERSEAVTIGVDGGGLDDLLGVAAIGRERETRRWLAWGHALIGPEGLDRRKANRARYDDFIADGDLTVVDGLPDDLDWIKERVGLVKEAGRLVRVGTDPACIGGLVDALAEIGVTQEAELLVGVPQGIRLMNAAKTTERKLVDGTFKHSGSRLMAWCVGNAKVRQTSTAVLIERAASGYGKIDPLMAMLNAVHLMTLNPTPPRSIYDDARAWGDDAAPAPETIDDEEEAWA